MLTRRTYPIALVTALAVAAGCGGSGSSKPAARPASTPVTAAPTTTTTRAGGDGQAGLLAAVNQTTAAKTARVELDETLTGPESVTTSGGGLVNFTESSAQLSIQADSRAGGESIELRVVNGRAYVRSSSNGSGWTSIATDGAASVTRGANDPTQYLRWLRGVSNDVRVVGPERVRNVATTKYEGTVDLSRIVGSKLSAEVAKLFSSDWSKLPVQVWVDNEGNVRKVALVMKLKAEGTTVAINVTVEFYDFGVPANIEAPTNVAAP
jgi:hypothetical protein